MNIDYELLKQQRDFLTSYPWHQKTDFPQEIDGIINLLDTLLDQIHNPNEQEDN